MTTAPKQNSTSTSTKRFFLLPVQSFAEELGERISIARRRCRLKQEELAQKSRTSLSTYKRIEQGDTTVSIGTVLSVLYCLDRLESSQGILAVLQKDDGLDRKLPKRIRKSADHAEKSGGGRNVKKRKAAAFLK